jgi:hydrogenase maturation factor
MASIYEIEKMVEAIAKQTKALCEAMGIDPMPMPNEEQATVVDNETIEELTDPDA